MGVENALLLLVALGLLLLVVLGFQRFSRKKIPELIVEQNLGLTVELARVATRATQATCLGNFDDDYVKQLLLETAEPDSKLRAHLDTVEFDEDLQFLRLSEGYCGRSSWKVIKYRCQLANVSESFYTCRLVSSGGDPSQSQPPLVCVKDQWLYTVIQPQQQNPDMMEIHSNVVPRQAYLKRLQGVIATCCEHELCTRGFSGIRVPCEGEPYHHRSCTNCVLGDQLKPEAAHVDAELAKLWDLAEKDVMYHSFINRGSEGEVDKIYWRKGVFAKKAFFVKPNFDREFEIATEVLHPNIVHCFGFGLSSKWSPAEEKYVSLDTLYMELLKESLESRIQEPIQQECPFSFQDIVSVLWQVADAMRELHGKRFIHGDLKPDNILLSRLEMPHSKSGKFYLAKVADFGCAQRVPPNGFANPESADGTSNEAFANPESADDKNAAVFFNSKVGSPKYAAPEVLERRLYEAEHRGKLALPPKHPEKIDVYSFGVVAYQMLTGVTKSQLYDGVKITDLKAGVIDGSLRPCIKSDIKKLDSDRKFLLKSLIVKCWDATPESRPSFSCICDFLETLPSKHGYMELFSAVMTFLKATITKRKDKSE